MKKGYKKGFSMVELIICLLLGSLLLLNITKNTSALFEVADTKNIGLSARQMDTFLYKLLGDIKGCDDITVRGSEYAIIKKSENGAIYEVENGIFYRNGEEMLHVDRASFVTDGASVVIQIKPKGMEEMKVRIYK